ncbi:nucleotidyltransferase family protein [Myxosarcina sp. GI1(2024)]
MKTLAEIEQILSQLKPIVAEKYHVTQLGIFGSYVRGEQDKSSDVDVLIDYQEAPSLLELIDLEFYLSERLGIKTDVVTKKGLKPRIKEKILAEVVYV